MAFVSKKKQHDEFKDLTEARVGLGMDLGLMVCPECRREVPPWRSTCADCDLPAVPKAGLAPLAPPPPAHLLEDPDEDDEDLDIDEHDGWEYVDIDEPEEEGYEYIIEDEDD